MKTRWIASAAVCLAVLLTPLSAQATTMQDPHDVGPGMLDIKSASVTSTSVDSNRILTLSVESYEPFGCNDLTGRMHIGRSLAFIIDYPSTPRVPDLRIRVQCESGTYTWRARLLGTQRRGVVVQRNTAIRPTDTTLSLLFSGEWYGDIGGEEPARWKVVSTRWITSTTAEVDSAPDTGWAVFDPQS